MDKEVMMGDNGILDFHNHDGSILVNNVIRNNENLNVNLLEDLDSSLDDYNNGLKVSRFAGDAVTQEMLNAVKTEAAEESVQKENETWRSHLILDKACKDGYEERLLEPSVESSCGWKSLLLDRTKEIAGLRRELEMISKLLTGHENRDVEALKNKERANQLQHKASGSIVSASSVWDTNDKHIGSVALTPEKLEDLRKLSPEKLINYFKAEMNQLKRDHDYTIQAMTEEYFSIKRRCLNLEECGSFSSLNKDKEFDVLRKKIPDIIWKLDKILLEDENLVLEGKNNGDYKNQLDSLILENRQLKDSLSKADQKMSQLSQAEENHRKLIRKPEENAEDSYVEASIYEEVYGSFVREFVNQIQCAKEETNLEHNITCAETAESYLAEEYCALIYKEALKEADKKLGELNMNVSEKERALRSEMVEKERLKEEIHRLECLVKEKDSLLQIHENDLATKTEKLEIVFQQINNLQYQIDQQAIVIQDKNKEVKAVSACALEKTEGYELEISELRQKLELVRKNMTITENEKVKSELKLSSTEAEKKKLKDQFVSTVLSLANWSKDIDYLECVVAEKTNKTNSRLQSMQSQLSDLLDEVDELKARESIYKQLMEKKTCDLQKAETEVDLLGNEIESLLDLLGKIYIALDHYSPILKHYCGIVEILKLVRRELRGEAKRLSVF